MQRQRETAPQRILVYCVWACVFLVYLGQIGASPEKGLMNLLGFLISVFIFLLPIFLYAHMGHQTHSAKVSVLFALFWGILFFVVDALVYKGGDPLATVFIMAHTYSYLAFGRFFPPSGTRSAPKKFEDGGTL